MPEVPVILTSLVTLVLIAFMLWFALGTQVNIRRGNEYLKWLQSGLVRLGRKTKLRWLGSSAVDLTIDHPNEPFSEVSVLVVLEPRDVVWWRLSRRRGRRDFIILRARLRRSPTFELEAGDASGWTGMHALDKLDSAAWERSSWADEAVVVAHTVGAPLEEARAHWEAFGDAGQAVWRLSVRREPPHLEVHVIPPHQSEKSSDALIQAFFDLARSVLSRA